MKCSRGVTRLELEFVSSVLEIATNIQRFSPISGDFLHYLGLITQEGFIAYHHHESAHSMKVNEYLRLLHSGIETINFSFE